MKQWRRRIAIIVILFVPCFALALDVQTVLEESSFTGGARTDTAIWLADEFRLISIDKKSHASLPCVLPKQARRITAIEGIREWLVVLTDAGLYVLSEKTRRWKGPIRISGDIRDLATDSNIIYVLTDAGLVLLNEAGIKQQTIQILRDDPRDRMQKIALYQDEIWVLGQKAVYLRYAKKEYCLPVISCDIVTPAAFAVGSTYGLIAIDTGRVYCFNKLEGTMLSRHPLLDGDQFVTAVLVDDMMAWLCTFDGIKLFDLSNNIWIPTPTVPVSLLDDSSIIIADDNRIYIGNNNGLYTCSRPYQLTGSCLVNAFIQHSTETVVFNCFDELPDTDRTCALSYRLSSFPDIWNQGIVSAHDASCVWDVSQLPLTNERCEVRIVHRNASFGRVFWFDTEMPALTLDPLIGPKQPGPVTITGSYNKQYVRGITIEPYDISALLDRSARRFKAVINLSPGKNRITATLTDGIGDQATDILTVYVSETNAENKENK